MKNRSSQLHSIIKMTTLAENEIRYFNSTVEEILKVINKNMSGSAAEYFTECCLSELNHLSYPQAIESAQEISNDKTSLSHEEHTAVFEFLSALGTSDTEDQLRICRYYCNIFEKFSESADENTIKKGKLYVSLFGMLALAAGIILI